MARDSNANIVRTYTQFYDEQKRIVAQYEAEEPSERCPNCGGTGEISLLTTRRKCQACHGIGFQPAARLTTYTYYPSGASEEMNDPPHGDDNQPVAFQHSPTKAGESLSPVYATPPTLKFKLVESWDQNRNLVRTDAFVLVNGNWIATEPW